MKDLGMMVRLLGTIFGVIWLLSRGEFDEDLFLDTQRNATESLVNTSAAAVVVPPRPVVDLVEQEF